jgi:predicted RNase H-like HicB family nuclease
MEKGVFDPYMRNAYACLMNYRVVLIESDEGYSASCPALRGCHSQGSTLDEALDNIKSAIIVIREGKHVVMSNGNARVTIPRYNPVNSFTMGAIAADAGLKPEEFRKLR